MCWNMQHSLISAITDLCNFTCTSVDMPVYSSDCWPNINKSLTKSLVIFQYENKKVISSLGNL